MSRLFFYEFLKFEIAPFFGPIDLCSPIKFFEIPLVRTIEYEMGILLI